MKSTELMIGDLINGFGVVRRVTSIHGFERPEDDGLLTTMIPGCEFPNSNLSFRACYALPIPLTGEILEKNGFEKQDDGWYKITLEEENLIGVQPFENVNWIFGANVFPNIIEHLNILYVHELQHALRICGIEKEITV